VTFDGEVTIMGSWRRALPLIAWLSALLVGLAVFHGLGSGPMAAPPLTDPGTWGAWAVARDPLIATVAVLRLVVLALAWYLVGVTTVGLLARLLRAARLVRLADALTLPLVRRLLQNALGVGLATAMVGAATAPVPTGAPIEPASGQPHATATAALEAEQATGHVSLVRADLAEDEEEATPVSMRLLEQGDEEAGSVSMRPGDRQESAEATLRVVEADEAEATGGDAHRVAPGESLWSIAQDALVERLDREPTDTEVRSYWQDVIEHNRDALADPDNPDLIFPGDEIRLPTTAPEA
jgi:hypothetical protein